MAYNPLDELKKGNVKFLYSINTNNLKTLIDYIRNSCDKNEIINGFLSLLIDEMPKFCFDVIYDSEEFIDEAKYILKNYYDFDFSLTKKEYVSYLNGCPIFFDFLKNRINDLIIKHKNDSSFLFDYMLKNEEKCSSVLKDLSLNKNLNVRFQFMKHLIKHYPDKVDNYYSDITKYLTVYNYQYAEQIEMFPDSMTTEQISELAYIVFENGNNELWDKMKELIYTQFDYNNLAHHLLYPIRVPYQYCDNTFLYAMHGLSPNKMVENVLGIAEFNKDSDKLFKTSLSGRLNISTNYSNKVSKKVLNEYLKYLKYFKQSKVLDPNYNHIERYGLSHLLEEYIDKYLSLSTRSDYEFIERGSTSSCYRIGDFVFKLIEMKWSYENTICPNLYIILPNLEEKFIRGEKNIVLAGLEVQKFLQHDAKNVPQEIFDLFTNELSSLGYIHTDRLMNGPCGDNCRLLDLWEEANNPFAPEWFKEYPLVLVDRDRVYDIDKPSIRELQSRY